MDDFREDDQAPLVSLLAKRFPEFFEEDPGAKMSHSFVILDFSKAGKKEEEPE